MANDDFKREFDKLMQEMEELVDKADNEDIAQIKADLIHVKSSDNDPVICNSESEFDLAMMYRITGVIGEIPYILIDHDTLSDDAIEYHYNEAKKKNKLFILPSIISSNTNLNPNIKTPYLLLTMKDGKLFMYPEEGTAFYVDDQLN